MARGGKRGSILSNGGLKMSDPTFLQAHFAAKMLSGFDNFDSLVLSDKLLLCVDSSLLSDIFRHKNFSNPSRIGQVMSWRMFLKLGAAGSRWKQLNPPGTDRQENKIFGQKLSSG